MVAKARVEPRRHEKVITAQVELAGPHGRRIAVGQCSLSDRETPSVKIESIGMCRCCLQCYCAAGIDREGSQRAA